MAALPAASHLRAPTKENPCAGRGVTLPFLAQSMIWLGVDLLDGWTEGKAIIPLPASFFFVCGRRRKRCRRLHSREAAEAAVRSQPGIYVPSRSRTQGSSSEAVAFRVNQRGLVLSISHTATSLRS